MPQQTPAAQVDTEVDEVETQRYQCPYCAATYDNEILARVHITRSEDPDHINRDGFMPETEILVIDEDDNVVDKLSKRPEDIDKNSVNENDLPDDYSERHKRALLIAAYNPYEQTYTELTERVNGALKSRNLDELSYSTVRRVIRQFYRPQEVDAEEQAKTEDTDGTSLSSLTAKQQAIIMATVANPDERNADIADRIGVAGSYPSQVFDKHGDVHDRLEQKVNSGMSVEDAVLDELTPSNIKELHRKDLLGKIGLNFGDRVQDGEIVEDEELWDRPVTEQRKAMSADPFEETSEDLTAEEEMDEAEVWGVGSPSEAETSTTAAELDEPAATTEAHSTVSNDVAEQEPEPEQVVEEEPEEPEPEIEETVEADTEPTVSDADMVPRGEVEALLEHVKFTRRVAQREAESNGDQTMKRQLALAEELERSIQDILD